MTPRILTASALLASTVAVATATTAVADAPANALRSAPTMRVVDSGIALLQFTTKNRLPRGKDGHPKLRIAFASGERVKSLIPAGRHGKDFKYNARVVVGTDAQVGTKYTVRFTFAGQKPVQRVVTLHAAR